MGQRSIIQRYRGFLVWLGLLCLGLWGLWGLGAAAVPAPGPVGLVLDIQGTIGPATADYVGRALSRAEAEGAELVVLRMDTPGGLDTSMRQIVKAITTSTVPVVTFVAPSGSRAASAGTYILYASHVAAMAPGTNLGAATPVELGGLPGSGTEPGSAEPKGGTEKETGRSTSPATVPADAKTRKIVNDAAAYLRSLAKLRGRNADWAERAVREGASLGAEDALAKGVIDLIAVDLQSLKKGLDGRTVRLPGGDRVLKTGDLVFRTLEPDWRSRLLSIIGDPNVAYILMLVGLYGLIYELASPGAVLPGTVGVISLLLALYAFQVLPVSYAGVALILLGLGLMLAEAFAPGFGALGLGGVAAFVIGSVILIDSDVPGYGVALPLIIGFAAASALTLILGIGFAVRARRRPVVTGREELIGAPGRAIRSFDREGSVRVHGEVWAARTDGILEQGQAVRVTGWDGLVLLVTPDKERRV